MIFEITLEVPLKSYLWLWTRRDAQVSVHQLWIRGARPKWFYPPWTESCPRVLLSKIVLPEISKIRVLETWWCVCVYLNYGFLIFLNGAIGIRSAISISLAIDVITIRWWWHQVCWRWRHHIYRRWWSWHSHWRWTRHSHRWRRWWNWSANATRRQVIFVIFHLQIGKVEVA